MKPMLFLILNLIFVIPAYGGQEDAVVGIYVTRTPGYSDLGTGFFTSGKGQIVTVYHLVRGATSINVVDAQRNAYTKVYVSYIAPAYDLAILQIMDKDVSTPYLPFACRAPLLSEELTVIGYPRGLPKQTFYTRSTVAGFNPSLAYRTASGARLFKSEIDVISVPLVAYSGMSGAPVISMNKVLGVFSGSLQEGGSLAWAIPCKYIDNVEKLAKFPQDITNWPQLTLMADTFRGLQRSFRSSDVGERLLEGFLDAVSARSSKSDGLPGVSRDLVFKMNMLRIMIQSALKDPQIMANRDVIHDYLDHSFQEFLKGTDEWGKANTEWGNKGQEVANRYTDLESWAKGEANLSYEAKNVLDNSLARINTDYTDLDRFYTNLQNNEASLQRVIPKLAKTVALMGENPGTDDIRNFLNGMLTLINEMEPIVKTYYSSWAVSGLRREISMHRRIASAFESIVYR